MKLTWFGHSAFMLDDGEHVVLLDPFISDNPVSDVDHTTLSPQTILLTHAHNDHVGDTVEIAKRSGATVIATFELANWIASQGVENTIGGNHGGTVTFAGGSAKFTPAWHTSSHTDSDGNVVAPGLPAGFIIHFGGRTIYASGDTALFLDMQLIGEVHPDIALLSIGDHFTMGPDDAFRAVTLIRPGTVVPSHYDTFPPIEQDAEKFKQRVEAETASRVLIMQPGETHEFPGR
jgi:L-ascorbate metabolism protein UlaG (beta-lactamase superfamily)